jgi:DNA-binding transcriptional LysR family regulator
MQLDFIRREIERMRAQVHRQRGEIRQLQRAGISTAAAEALLERMFDKIDDLAPSETSSKKINLGQPEAKSWEDVSGDRTEVVRSKG